MSKLLYRVCEGVKPKRDNRSIIDTCQVPGTGSVIERNYGKALWGTIHQITMPSRYGTAGEGKKRACLGRCHTPSLGAKLRQGECLCGSSSVVS